MKLKQKNGMSIITLAIMVVVVIAIISGVILFVTHNSKENLNVVQKAENSEKSETKDNADYNGKYVIYINDYKIIFGKTKITDIIANVGLDVIEDKTYNETNESIETKQEIANSINNIVTIETKESKRTVKLSDGKNIIIKGFSDIINSLSTLANNSIDDPEFDISTGTKITFVDNKFGKNISMGDYFTEYEYENHVDITGTSHGSGGIIYVSQTKRFAHDFFAYYLDDNYKVVNMTVNLDYLRF